jgi:hypothetical protein
MKTYLLLLSYLITAGSLLAQKTNNLPPIQIDRPDQTECSYIVPKNHFQLETGFSFEKINKNTERLVYPTALWKYGVNEKFELRLITEAVTLKQNNIKVSGITPIRIGFKTKLLEENGIVPLTSIICHLSVPKVASENFKATYFAPSFRFTMQNTLTDKVSLGYNLGAEWNGEDPTPTFIYTVTSGIILTDKLGFYAELYGFAPQYAQADHRADGGFTYLVKNNILIDISGGFGISPNAPSYYGALGFSIRLPK